MKFSLNLNIFPRKSSDCQDALISTNTYISQQKNEEKSDNFQMNTPLDVTDTQQLTKSSSSNFLNRTSKKPIRVSKNKQNPLSQRETNVNSKPSSNKKSVSHIPLKVKK
jgi:hypothetical protein